MRIFFIFAEEKMQNSDIDTLFGQLKRLFTPTKTDPKDSSSKNPA